MTEIETLTGLTEAEFINTVKSIMKTLAPKFCFGIYGYEDIEQEGFIAALLAVRHPNYDRTKNLANFLFMAIKRSLINLKRDKYMRYETPCKTCPLYRGDNVCSVFASRGDCEQYAAWDRRNGVKRSLMQPQLFSSITHTVECPESFCLDNVDDTQRVAMMELININLSASLRIIFLKMLGGVFVRVQDRKDVRIAIARIIAESGEFDELAAGLIAGLGGVDGEKAS